VHKGAASRRLSPVPSFGDAFYEGLARDLLDRNGPEVLMRLRLDVIQARREGHARGADLLIQIADAAERLLRQNEECG
jgi:hypothetical protein